MTANNGSKKSIFEDFEDFIKHYGFLEFTTKEMEWGNTKKINLSLDQFRESVMSSGK